MGGVICGDNASVKLEEELETNWSSERIMWFLKVLGEDRMHRMYV